MAKRRSFSDRVTDSFRVITELDLSHAYERQAGSIVLALLAVLLVAGVLVTGRARRDHASIPVEIELPAAAGLASGDPVLVRGVRVGQVERVELVSPGHVRVMLTVDEAHAPRADAGAQLVALDLVGSQAVLYDPGRAAEPLAADRPVTGSPSVTLGDQVAGLRAQAAELVVGLREFEPAVLAAEVRRTRAALARAQAAAGPRPADSLATAVQAAAARGDSLIQHLGALRASFPRDAIQAQRESLATNAAALLAEVGEVQGSLDRLRVAVAGQEGSVGRFTRDTVFRQELDAARTSLRSLMEKFGGRRRPEQPQSP